MLAFKVGQKNKSKIVAVPDCDCGKEAKVSLGKDGITKHKCLTCFVNPPQDSKFTNRNAAFLRKVGLLG